MLDALEQAVTDRDTARRAGALPPPPPSLPDAPGRIPDALVPRARRLLESLDAQEQAIAGDILRVRAELARVSHADAPSPRTVAPRHHGGFEARA